MGRAKQLVEGPLDLYGVGDKLTVSEKGEFTLCLPLASGEDAQVSGLSLPKLTTEFPRYELKEVEEDIRKRSFDEGGNDLVLNCERIEKSTKILKFMECHKFRGPDISIQVGPFLIVGSRKW